MDLDIYRGANSDILYKYYLPETTSKSRQKWYLNQVALMPQALRVFLVDLKSHTCIHDEKWLYTKCRAMLWQHANFLHLFKYFANLWNILSLSLYIDRKLEELSHWNTIKLFSRTTLRLSYIQMRSIIHADPTIRT